jgi:hypothetical protein
LIDAIFAIGQRGDKGFAVLTGRILLTALALTLP